VDITLWAQATVTEAGAPPDDWIAYQIIHDELNINLTYVIVPTGADGEAKMNAAAAANDLPDLMQMVPANEDRRGALYQMVNLGLLAPVEDLMPLMPERVKTHYNDQFAINLVTFNDHQYGFPEVPPLPKREGLVIRKDWLDKLSLAAPATTEELFNVAKASQSRTQMEMARMIPTVLVASSMGPVLVRALISSLALMACRVCGTLLTPQTLD
jgi:putative aldouronate transport system substrate-binding protein